MMQNNKSYIIAEAGVNHNGNLDLAVELIVSAAKAGADAIKFQTFNADKIVHPEATAAQYQQKSSYINKQYELLKKLELTKENFIYLKNIAEKNNIQFLSTPFDVDSLNFLVQLNLPYIKISSGDITYGPLLLKAAQHNKKILLSTGMASMQEILHALYVIVYGYQHPLKTPKSLREIIDFAQSVDWQSILLGKVIVLHCTSEYPAPLNEINLNVLDTFKQSFGLHVGYSDHSKSIIVPVLAVAKGASCIEKHFTLDNHLSGPDHKASLNVKQFTKMVKQIRLAETILGDYEKIVTLSESKNKSLVRRGIYAAHKVFKNHTIIEKDLICLRPCMGVSTMKFWEFIGTTLDKEVDFLDHL